MLRLPSGVLLAGDPNVDDVARPGDIVLQGTDGRWRKGSEDDWEPVPRVGTVRTISDGMLVLETPYGTLMRESDQWEDLDVGALVLYDERPKILDSLPHKNIEMHPLGDSFRPADLITSLPGLEWENFSGFSELVLEARRVADIHMDLASREKLQMLGASPARGILFDGPPGTGKTLLAQIMAAQSGAAFYQVTTAALGGRLVSESEQRLQKIYDDARANDLSLIFIDEIDALTGHRDIGSDQNSRLVNVFLTNMDGVSAPRNVITIGTTNRKAAIDRALLRPGRFDRQLTFRHPDASDRSEILGRAKIRTEGDLPIEEVAQKTSGWTAADLNSIWQHAAEHCVASGRTSIFPDHFLLGFERARTSRLQKETETT